MNTDQFKLTDEEMSDIVKETNTSAFPVASAVRATHDAILAKVSAYLEETAEPIEFIHWLWDKGYECRSRNNYGVPEEVSECLPVLLQQFRSEVSPTKENGEKG